MSGTEIGFATLVFLVALALAFDFMNGLHDAANSIATVVSTGVLKPHYAVAFAAFFNFVAILIFHLKVASTVGKGIVDPMVIDHYVIFGALVGAISWNAITWFFGLPSSSSHALIGGLIGAGVAKMGFGSLVASGITKCGVHLHFPVGGVRARRAAAGGGVVDLQARVAEPHRPVVPAAADRFRRGL